MGDTQIEVAPQYHRHTLGGMAAVLTTVLIAVVGYFGYATGQYVTEIKKNTVAAAEHTREVQLERNDLANYRRAVDLNQELEKLILIRGALWPTTTMDRLSLSNHLSTLPELTKERGHGLEPSGIELKQDSH